MLRLHIPDSCYNTVSLFCASSSSNLTLISSFTPSPGSYYLNSQHVKEICETFYHCVSQRSDSNFKKQCAAYVHLSINSPSHFILLAIFSPAMAKPPSALAPVWGSHTHFSQHSPGTWILRGMGQSGPGSITSTLQRDTHATCPSRHIHWYLQLGKKV